MAGVRFGEVIGKHLRALPLTLSLSHRERGRVARSERHSGVPSPIGRRTG